MATRQTIREEVERRLGDTTNVVWTDADLNGYIDNVIRGLYPTFFRFDAATTTAGAGPLQNLPSGARNVYAIAVQMTNSARPIPVSGWTEGSTAAFIPVTGITGATIVWSWTKGFTAPAADGTTLDLNAEVEEFVILRTHLTALEHLLGSRVKQDKYFALNLRQAVTEADIATLIDALHASLDERMQRAIPLPQPVN